MVTILYANAQKRFILMNTFPLLRKRIKAKIFSRFYERMITSAALMFSYDFALMLMPILAYCRHGMSFSPK